MSLQCDASPHAILLIAAGDVLEKDPEWEVAAFSASECCRGGRPGLIPVFHAAYWATF